MDHNGSNDVAISTAEGGGGPPKTPASNGKILPATASGVNGKAPTCPMTPTGTSPSSSSQRLIVTPANEVEMKLVGGDNDNDNGPPMLPLQASPEKEKNEARRNRRYLRKGAGAPMTTSRERVEMALKTNQLYEEEEEIGEEATMKR